MTQFNDAYLYASPGPQWVNSSNGVINSSPPEKNGHHFADDIFNHISLSENIKISIQTSLNFVPVGPIDNKSVLIQLMTWCRPGDKTLSEPILTQFTDAYMRH